MEYLWLLVVVLTMIVYPVVLIRSALAGKQWAKDTLEAMRFLGGDLMTPSAWRALPPEPERPPAPPAEVPKEPGRLVA
ncbi:MAG TPA: hypothetical protein VF210_10900 [Pseudomonadales bacterium]